MFFFARKYVDHLEAEIEHLREQVQYHTQRGDRALDQLAFARSGHSVTTSAPAAPYVAPDPLAEARRIMEDEGLVNAGAITG